MRWWVVPPSGRLELPLEIGDYDVEVLSRDAHVSAHGDWRSTAWRTGHLRVGGAGRAAVALDVAKVRLEPRVTGPGAGALPLVATLRGRHGQVVLVEPGDEVLTVLVAADAYELSGRAASADTRVSFGPESVVVGPGDSPSFVFDVATQETDVDVLLEGDLPESEREVALMAADGTWWAKAGPRPGGRSVAIVPTAASRPGPVHVRLGGPGWASATHEVVRLPTPDGPVVARREVRSVRFAAETGGVPLPREFFVRIGPPGGPPAASRSFGEAAPVLADAPYDVWIGAPPHAWRVLESARFTEPERALPVPVRRVRISLAVDGRSVEASEAQYLHLMLSQAPDFDVYSGDALPFVDGAYETWLLPGEYWVYLEAPFGGFVPPPGIPSGARALGPLVVDADPETHVSFDVGTVEVEVTVTDGGDSLPDGTDDNPRGLISLGGSGQPSVGYLAFVPVVRELPQTGEASVSLRVLEGVYDFRFPARAIGEDYPDLPEPRLLTGILLR